MSARCEGEGDREERLRARWSCALCQLERCFGVATSAEEVRARLGDLEVDLALPAGWLAFGRALGYAGRIRRSSAYRLLSTPPPFLLVGADADDLLLVRAHKGRELVVVDPETGRARVASVRSLLPRYRHLVQLRPSRPDASRGLAGLLFSRRFWPALAQVAAASVVINLLALATPLFMMTVYNRVIRYGALTTLDVLLVGMVSLVAVELALRALRGRIAAHAGARLDVEVGREAASRVLQLPLATIERLAPGRLLERLRQLDQLRPLLSGHLPLLLVDLLFVGLFLAVIFVLAPVLGWITLAGGLGFALLGWLARRPLERAARTHSQLVTRKNARLLEALAHAPTVKALGLEPEMEQRYRAELYGTAWAGLETGARGQLAASLAQAVQHLTALAVVYAGARMVVAGELTIGALIAASILAARTLAPLRQLFLNWAQLQQAREAWRRVDRLLQEPVSAPAVRRALGEVELRGALKLERVRFRYADDRPWALDGIDLEVPAGAMVALVGAPGSGKSTLLALIAGLHRPQEGRVLVDGHEVRHLPDAVHRRRLGFVPQEVQLFAGTIADNIALGAEDRSRARVIAAARFVGLHDVVSRLPAGYDTELGEGGAGLSMGQKQLLTIARALIRNPRILLLDEATSALDPTSERRLFEHLRRAGRGRTLLLATHRPQAVAFCDEAVVLREGRILHRGPAAQVAQAMRRGAVAAPASLEVAGGT